MKTRKNFCNLILVQTAWANSYILNKDFLHYLISLKHKNLYLYVCVSYEYTYIIIIACSQPEMYNSNQKGSTLQKKRFLHFEMV